MPTFVKPLEFSQESLNKRIAGIRLRNMQGAKDITMRVPLSGIIRLNAPSEVGKSACFKPFEAMVTSKFRDKRSINSLVRTDAEKGSLEVLLANGTQIGMYLDKTNINKCFYGIIYPDGRKEKLNYIPFPEKIPELLGWYTTGIKKPDFCINVRRKGPLAILETEKRLNSEVIGVALNCEELENTISAVSRNIESIGQDLTMLIQRESQVNFAMQSLDIQDTQDLEIELKILTENGSKLDLLTQAASTISDCYSLISRKPDLIKVENIDNELDTLSKLTQIENEANYLISTPVPKVKEVRELDRELTFLDLLVNLESSISKFSTLSKPTLVEEPKELNIDMLVQLNNLEENINRMLVLGENPVSPGVEISNIENELSILEEVQGIQKSTQRYLSLTQKGNLIAFKNTKVNLEEIISEIQLLRKYTLEMDKTSKKIKSIKEELSKYQCPTCGQYYFNGKHEHEVSR